MTEVEDLLRDTFRGHEPEAGRADELATGARRLARDRRRRRLAVGGTLVSVCAVVVGGLALRPDRGGQPAAGGTPAGWRIESSLGLEVSVPASWTVNDAGCGGGSTPTVVRAQGVVALCLGPPEAPTKQVVAISPGRTTTLYGGVPANGDHGELRLKDGRFGTWTYFPSRNATVTVRTPDAALARRILASADPVDVDSRGCATNRPAIDWPAPHKPVRPVRVPAAPKDAALCYYGDGTEHTGILQTSAPVTGADLDALVRAVNSTPVGPAATPKGCAAADDPNVLLTFHYPSQRPVLVQVAFTGCVGRSVVDGSGESAPTVTLLSAFERVLHTGYGYSEPLPR